MWSLFILFLQCPYSVILMKILTELQVRHFSLVFFFGGFYSSSRCRPYSSLYFKCFSRAGAPLNHSFLDIHLFRCPEGISEGLPCHPRSVQPISRMFPHSSHLIQPVLSLFWIVQWCIFWAALTHRSFPGSYLTLLFSRRYSQILFEVWRKNDLPSVKCLSPRSVKFFSSLTQALRFDSSGVSQ